MNNNSIVIFVSDMMSSIRVEAAISALNFTSIVISSLNDLGGYQNDDGRRQPGEPTSGLTGILADKITRWQPVLLIFDIGSTQLPWSDWLPSLKSSPATRNIPIICYGPHVDAQALARAVELGSELAVPRSKFFKELNNIIIDNVREDNRQGMRQACKDPLPDEALQGLFEFNKRNFFEAHEHLEAAWNNGPNPGSELYRGILQIAVAYLQIERKNYQGAVKMFLRSRQWLNSVPGECRGIDIAQLKKDKEAVYDEVVSLGPNRLVKFDASNLRPIKFSLPNRSFMSEG